jgi:hypothetical protein
MFEKRKGSRCVEKDFESAALSSETLSGLLFRELPLLKDAVAKSPVWRFSPPTAFWNSLIILSSGFCLLNSAAAS